MKKWILKAIVQKTIASLPFSFRLNYLFQKHITKAVVLNKDFFEDLLRHSGILLTQHTKFNSTGLSAKRVLELGTGWHPIVPIAFFLSGAKEIVTVDLRDLIRKENIETLIAWFLRYEESGELKKFIPFIDQDRLQLLHAIDQNIEHLSVQDILAQLHIKHEIGDITQMNLQANSFDVMSSVNVLEHIYAEYLGEILQTMSELSTKGSFHYHSFGCYDHFYHIDKSISKFNFLQYSQKKWRFIDNDIQPQNRLRVNQIGDLLRKVGFSVLAELHSAPNLEEYTKVKVHPDFARLDPAVSAIDYGTYVLTVTR